LTAVGAKVTGPRQLQFDRALDAVLPPIALSSSSAPMRSPAMPMTRRPGLAICAPIAAGRPKPIVPNPPDVIQRLGLSKPKTCATRIC
jgi:hypothetical protein